MIFGAEAATKVDPLWCVGMTAMTDEIARRRATSPGDVIRNTIQVSCSDGNSEEQVINGFILCDADGRGDR